MTPSSRRPRLLAIMGSGETAPTMVEVHKGLLARLGPPPPVAVVLDTPFGFQTNADDLVVRTGDYFRRQVGVDVSVASLRRGDATPAEVDAAVATLRRADYVFSGPGSPTYALRQWQGTAVPVVLAEKLARGGCVTFASAAALTLGVATVPVYEIYKAGEPPAWRPGLDLLAAVGLRAAVIPHYDNAEGGTHDTRYCYLGEERLAAMEEGLPPDTFVLGVDEHTAVVLDAGARTAEVIGRGGLTVRCRGRSARFPAGSSVTLDDLVVAAEELGSGTTPSTAGPVPAEAARSARGDDDERAGDDAVGTATSPLLEATAEASREVDEALAGDDATAAVQATLRLEQALHDWSSDALQSDEPDRARAVLRDLLTRIGEAGADAARVRAESLRPLIDGVVALRDEARAAEDWDTADALRRLLSRAGVRLDDTAEGTTWRLER